MFSIPKSNRKKAWNDLLSEIEMYLSVREYDTGTLLEYVQNHISLQLIPGKLTDPIQCRAIKIEDFASKTADNESIDLTHQESVNKQIYVYDNKLETLLTPARPTNVFWSKKLSNMMQQDFTLFEYYNHQKQIFNLWEKYGIGRFKKY